MSAKTRFERVDHALELDESLHVHAAERIAQRVAGLLILAIIVAALLGLFGDGRLAATSIAGDTATLRYERILRNSKETVLEVEVGSGDTRIFIPLHHFGNFELERVVPEPAATRIADGFAIYVFEPGSPATLRFHFIPRKTGATTSVMRVGGDTFTLHQQVLP